MKDGNTAQASRRGNTALQTVFVLAGILFLLLPALWNRFPLFYSDSGAYMANAFEGTVPWGRPTGYGLFIRFTAWGGNLWITLVAQTTLCVLLLWWVLAFLRVKARLWAFLAALLALAGTGLNWYMGQIMPDLFAGFVALAFWVQTAPKCVPRWQRIIFSCMAFLFCVTHYSHMALLLSLSLGGCIWAIWRFIRKRDALPLQRIIWSLFPAVASILFFYGTNYANGYGWRMTRSLHVFTMAKLSSNGLLAEYLQETCPDHGWSLCPYQDSLPSSAAAFIWNEDSPFRKTGWWEGCEPQYDSLLSDFFSRPGYVVRYAGDGLKCTAMQMVKFRAGEGMGPKSKDSSPYQVFARALPEQQDRFAASRQNTSRLNFEAETWMLKGIMGLSALMMMLLLVWRRKHLRRESWGLVLILCAAYVLNAAITGGLANVYSRLQSRVAWLIPFLAIVLLAEGIREWRQARTQRPDR